MDQIKESNVVDRQNIQDILALTPMQEGLLYHYLKNPESDLYFEQLCLGLSGHIEETTFEKAWNFVVETNEMLRTVFRWEKLENPVQLILKHHKLQPVYYDLTGLNHSETHGPLQEIKVKDRQKKFRLDGVEIPFRVTLCKIKEKKYMMIISSHHILYDGWSNGIILKEFFYTYRDLANGKELLKPAKTKYRQFVRWIRTQESDISSREKFWQGYLCDFDTPTEISIKKKDKGTEIYSQESLNITIEKRTGTRLNEFIRQHKITMAVLLYSTWGILLQRYNNSKDVVFGTTVSGRSPNIKGIEDIVGLFINTVPLRVQTMPTAKEKIIDLCQRVYKALQVREPYENTTLVKIREYIRSIQPQGKELFDSIVVMENYPLLKHLRLRSADLPFSIDSYSAFEMTNYDLNLRIILSGEIDIGFIYNSDRFEGQIIERLSRHFTRILDDIIENPGKHLYEIEMLSPQEKNWVLFDFNETKSEYPIDQTLHRLFAEQAERTPDHMALTGQIPNSKFQIPNKEASFGQLVNAIGEIQLSYMDLNEKTDQVACLLREKGVGADTIVGIMMERSLEMIIGIFGILKAGGTYLPVDAGFPKERINYMLADSGASILVSKVSELSKLSEVGERIELIMLDNTMDDFTTVPTPHHIPPGTHTLPYHPTKPTKPTHPTHLCYIIYTSGSTGRPKGVMVVHTAVVNTLSALQRMYPFTSSDVYLLKTSYLFDVSVTELFGWYWQGGRLALLEPGGEKDPQKIIDVIEALEVTHINFVPSLFSALIERLEQPWNSGKLRCLKYIFLAGEVILPGLIKRFHEIGFKVPLENLYGPTEAAVYASRYPLAQWNGKGDIPIGKPIQNVKLYILDRNNQLQPLGVPGELVISGMGLARGYLNNPLLTAEKFNHDLWYFQDYQDGQKYKQKFNQKLLRGCPEASRGGFLEKSPPGRRRQKIYLTGDLARWLLHGNIEFLGRIDQQIKIRGYRIELEEIENLLMKYPGIKQAVVTARVRENYEKYLCAYIVTGKPIEISQLREYLSRELPDYMVPWYFVSLERFPVTPSGKINRLGLPEPVISAGEKYNAPRDNLEKALVQLWSEVLGIEVNKISINANFFKLGGHSLKATSLIAKIHKKLEIKIPLADFFKISTVRRMARYIKPITTHIQHKFTAIETAEQKEYYPLSPAQKRLYILQQLETDNTGYNMPYIIPITITDDAESNNKKFLPGSSGEGPKVKEKLESTIKKLIHRHESLRTSFEIINEEPVQKIHQEVVLTIDYYETSEAEVREMIPGLIRSFDLSRVPLLRAALIKIESSRLILFIDIHHIITDGTSHFILENEFWQLYAGKELPLLKLQYKDFSQWQHRPGQKELLKNQQSYWIHLFSDELPKLQLPVDYPRSFMQRFEGSIIQFVLDEKETYILKEIAAAADATLYMAILCLWTVLLSKLSGQEDIIIGTPIAARRHADLERIIGMFVNALPIRNYPVGEKPLNQFLLEVKQRTLEAYENQEYPFEELVEKVSPRRDTGRNPMFDVMINLLNQQDYQGNFTSINNIDEGRSSGFDNIRNTSKFDLSLTAVEIEKRIIFDLEYSTSLFKVSTIKRIIGYFKNILSGLSADREVKISEIEILTGEEKQEILRLSQVERKYALDKTLHRLFAEQVERTPDQIAVVGVGTSAARPLKGFIASDTRKRLKHVTYNELNNQSHHLAQCLREKGVIQDSIVGIMIERSLEMIAGILGILEAGGAYLPINPKNPAERVKYILADSGAKMMLTSDAINRVPTSLSVSTLTCQVGPANLAYVIYTSGSTGNPKGVVITHANFSQLIHWGYDFGIGPKDRFIQNLSYYFDWSVWEIFLALTTGAGLFMITEETLLNPDLQVDFILANGITVLHITPSQFQYLLNVGKRLSPLKYLFLGAEKLTYDLVKRSMAAVNKECRLFNMYGPTEATIISATLEIHRHQVQEYSSLTSVPIGIPAGNMILLVLNRYLQLCPIGVIGELYIGGPGTAAGYLNNPELTSKKFIKSFCGGVQMLHGAVFSKSAPLAAGGKIYKTGDLVRWLEDRTVEYLGRLDFQVKIRGYRIEPGEIENQLLNHRSIREAVVIDLEFENSEKYLCGYIILEKNHPFESNETMALELKRYLSGCLPDYMIPAYFIRVDHIPLNNNAKIDRNALPKPEVKKGNRYTAPGDEVEKKLAAIWSQVLEVDEEIIGIDDDFFELGGHSLKATIMISRVHKELNIKIPLVEVFETPFIRGLARYIKMNTMEIKDKHTSLGIAEEREYYPLSPAQKRLYILQQLEDENTGYNMPYIMPIPTAADVTKEKLESIFKELISRHESLRTSFEIVNEEPVQKIHPEIVLAIDYYETSQAGVREIVPGLIRSFDLSRAPLLRAVLIKIESSRLILFIDIHHIITDGTSQLILENEFWRLYAGKELPLLKLQYKDFSQWQYRPEQKELLKDQQSYWVHLFSDELPVLQLPIDYPRPLMQRFEGSIIQFVLDEKETHTLKDFADAADATLYMSILCLWTVLLSKLSGQEDIIVGTPIAARRHADLERIIGMFVNTLAIRNYPVGGKSLKEFLLEVKQRTLEAYENQEYPFEELVEEVSLRRDTGRNPIFDVMINLLNQQDIQGYFPGINDIDEGRSSEYDYIRNTSKFDLSLTAVEIDERIVFDLEYSTCLFKSSTIKRIIGYFKNLLSCLSADWGVKISAIEILTGEEKQEILRLSQGVEKKYNLDMSLHSCFEEQAARTPDNIAVKGVGTSAARPLKGFIASDIGKHLMHVTYKELNKKSHQLACFLQEKGVQTNMVVGLMVERSLELIVGMLGVLKAGAAYLPIEPDYPQDRIEYMLADSGTRVLVSKVSELSKLSEVGGKIELIMLDNTMDDFTAIPTPHLISAGTRTPLTHPTHPTHPTHLCYVIYTSGSTGKPKGVLVGHSGVVRLVKNADFIDFDERQRLLMTGSIGFDITTFEIWGSLLNGLGLFLEDKSVLLDMEKLKDAVVKNDISLLHLIPQLFNQVIDQCPGVFARLEYFLVGGDLVRPVAVSQLRNQYPHVKIIHCYGPTENTTFTTTFPVDREYPERLPIGKPINNTTVYILNPHGHLQPIGAVGELCTGGDGIAIGYLNNPELTNRKFQLPDKSRYNRSYRSHMSHIIYHTGDLARWLPDGNIEFLGRMDLQVKIRGIRIEPGEIENHLVKHKDIKGVVVAAKEDVHSENHLYAFIVPREKLDLKELRVYLATRLPGYMVPAYFIKLERIPLTPSGKPDRKALLASAVPNLETGTKYIAPRSEIENIIANIWKKLLGLDSVGVHDNFFEIGGSSFTIIRLASQLKKAFKKDIPVTSLFKFPTIASMADHLSEGETASTTAKTPGRPAPDRGGEVSIAVIGMSGRFPGAKTIDEFWENLQNSVESITHFTDEELISLGVEREVVDDPRFIPAKGVLADKEYFDASFFDYTPSDASIMDPQMRIFHECCWEALENAGYDPGTYDGVIGLYAGASSGHYREIPLLPSDITSGQGDEVLFDVKDFLSTRVAYKLDLKGPCVTVQTACSTSLAAVALACQGLLSGACDMVLAGGVSITLLNDTGYYYLEGGIASADGRCRAFDAGASGTVSGNGAGVVVLKHLADALADRDRIDAVIKGFGLNNDGKNRVGFTAPGIEGQTLVINTALQMANAAPETIGYIETHGTGTVLGDSVEMESLKQAFKIAASNKKNYCAVGSVKTNIGHLDAAAGIAGFIKTVLILKHGLIPPTLHFKTPNPGIDFENSPFYVNTQLKEWKNDMFPLRAGVSAFGIGGTNAHVILEQAPVIGEKRKDKEYQLVLLSAKTETALDNMTKNLAEHFKLNPAINLADAAYTLQVGRKHCKYRKMLVCSSMDETIDTLSLPHPGRVPASVCQIENRPVIFMFPGQGSQYVNMGLDLYRTDPVFRREMDRCFDILKRLIDHNLKEILYPTHPAPSGPPSQEGSKGGSPCPPGECVGAPDQEAPSPVTRHPSPDISQIEIAPLVIFIFEYSLARLLMYWGIKPHNMIGYSLGEYTAACLSGVFSLESALELIVYRNQLFKELSSGAMLSVPLSRKELEPLFDEFIGYSSLCLSLAIDNGPSCVAAGPEENIEAFAAYMKKKKYVCMRINNSHAVHSSMMDPISQKFAGKVSQLDLKEPQIPYISNVSGGFITGETVIDPAYWASHLSSTVQFAAGVQVLAKEKNAIFIEIGPGYDLSSLAARYLDDPYRVVNIIPPSQRKISGIKYLLSKIGQLWLYGIHVDWPAFYSGAVRYRLPLPTYPFERKRYPVDGKFRPDVKSVVREQERADIADWFYTLSWKRSSLAGPAPGNTADQCNWLVFIGEHPLGPQLVKQLLQKGESVITVRVGEVFTTIGQATYNINPQNEDDYETLLGQLKASGQLPTRIIHLWGVTELTGESQGADEHYSIDKILDLGFYSLVYLTRALVKQSISQDLHMLVVTNDMQEVTGNERLCPGKSTVLGPVKVIPQEHPFIICRSVDITAASPGELPAAKLCQQLLEEFTGESSDTVIAYRGPFRWVQMFEPRRLDENITKETSLILKHNGFYLLTGGLGEIGLVLAEYMVKQVKARVILTGGSPFPSRDQWDRWLAEHDDQNRISIRIKKIRQLEELGGEVMSANIDAADYPRMQQIITQAQERWGPLNGVIHLAGNTRDTSLNALTQIGKAECQEHFRSKVFGVLVLEKILREKSFDFCWLMSSIGSILGGLGFVAYSAANNFMDAFVNRYNRLKPSNSTRWISVNWDKMEPGETVTAFERILSRVKENQLVVSTGGRLQQRIDQWLKLESLRKDLHPVQGKKEKESAGRHRPDLISTYEAPTNPDEGQIVDIWQQMFGFEPIGIRDDFFELGGDSLKAILVIARIHRELNVEIPIKEFFNHPTIAGLVKYSHIAQSRTYSAITPVEKKEYYPLSSAQQRLYILKQMVPGSTAYNLPCVFILEGNLKLEKLQWVFTALINRFESFRTCFILINGQPVQKVHKNLDFEIEYFEMAKVEAKNQELRAKSYIDSFIRSFDLFRAPLLRVGLIKIEEKKFVFMVDMHHIITDGTSMEIFNREFMAVYDDKSEALPALRIQYKDFSHWQQSKEVKEALLKQEVYWLEQFMGEIPVLNLITDFPRPLVQKFVGTTVEFELSAGETKALNDMARSKRVTLFMILLAVYNILLFKLSSQEDIIVGTPVNGRRHAGLQHIIGMFVNSVAMRTNPVGEKNFDRFLTEVKEITLQAFENQDYPFEDLVERVGAARDTGRNPIFDIMFTLQDFDTPGITTPGIELNPYVFDRGVSNFDLSLRCYQSDNILRGTFEFCTELFKITTIERFVNFLRIIISMVIRDPEIKPAEIEIISSEEKKQLLLDMNDTRTDYPRDKTIDLLFEEQAEKSPENVALVGPTPIGQRPVQGVGTRFIAYDSKEQPIHVTYRELNNKSNGLAHVLRGKGVFPDSIVGIMMDRSLEMIIGIIGILKAGGAYLPINPEDPAERIDFMLKDSSLQILLTDNPSRHFNYQLSIINCQLSMNEETPSAVDFSKSQAAAHSSQLAYVIYTSGTTGHPKGTLIKHSNVIRVVKKCNYIDLKATDRILQLSNYAFDGSVFDIYGALLNGAVLVLIDRDRLLALDQLAGVIKKDQITVFFVTTALFNMLVDLEIDCLNKVKKVLFGGEEVSTQHCRKALGYMGKHRIIHVYGPTETTVYATYYVIRHIHKTQRTIPIGTPISNTTIYILDKYLKPVPVGIHGEIYIGGSGVARGYLNNPELTWEKFRLLEKNRYNRSYRSYRSYIIYKTGDLARWLSDGYIEFLGRIDHQVKIRGFRVELTEIEHHLLDHPGIKEGVVTLSENEKGDKYLCAYFVAKPHAQEVKNEDIEPGKLREYLSAKLPDYMIPAYFVSLKQIPLTANGKLDRRVLPAPGVGTEREYAAPGNQVEMILVELWSEVLEIEKNKISIDDNFFEIGGHSLKATILMSRIHKAFNVRIPLSQMFNTPTIRALASCIGKAAVQRYISLEIPEKKEFYPLSAAQKRLYIVQQLDPKSTTYNMSSVISLEGKLDMERIKGTLRKIIHRHEILRTSIQLIDGLPFQKIHEKIEVDIEVYQPTDSDRQTLTQLTTNFIRPFDLSCAPLLRIGLIKIHENHNLLMTDMHHIVSDAASNEILKKDLLRLYKGETLPQLRYQYKDFAQWQTRQILLGEMKKQEEYWLAEFKEPPPVLAIPTDYPREAVKNHEEKLLSFLIAPRETEKLREFTLKENVTMFILALTLFIVLLFKITRQEDIVLGIVLAGRRHRDLEDIMGFFVNPLVLRNHPRGDKSFIRFLREVRTKTLEAFDNQDYQFEDLVEKLMLEREPGRNPLFDVLFTFTSYGTVNSSFSSTKNREKEKQDLKTILHPGGERIAAKFDLIFTGSDALGDRLNFNIKYSTGLFKTGTIEKFMEYFKKIVSAVCTDESIHLKKIKIAHELDTAVSEIYDSDVIEFEF